MWCSVVGHVVHDVSKDCISFDLLESEVEDTVVLQNFVNYVPNNTPLLPTKTHIFKFTLLYSVHCSGTSCILCIMHVAGDTGSLQPTAGRTPTPTCCVAAQEGALRPAD